MPKWNIIMSHDWPASELFLWPCAGCMHWMVSERRPCTWTSNTFLVGVSCLLQGGNWNAKVSNGYAFTFYISFFCLFYWRSTGCTQIMFVPWDYSFSVHSRCVQKKKIPLSWSMMSLIKNHFQPLVVSKSQHINQSDITHKLLSVVLCLLNWAVFASICKPCSHCWVIRTCQCVPLPAVHQPWITSVTIAVTAMFTNPSIACLVIEWWMITTNWTTKH